MSEPLFDRFAKKAFDLTTATFGYDSTWQPSSEGSSLQSAKVHLREPSSEFDLSGIAYTPKTHIMEWKKGDLRGLETVFESGNESVTINGISYRVIHVKAITDGNVFQAVLEKA